MAIYNLIWAILAAIPFVIAMLIAVVVIAASIEVWIVENAEMRQRIKRRAQENEEVSHSKVDG